MARADELLRNGSIMESASHRGVPTAMPTLTVARAGGTDRMAGVARSKTALEIPVARISPDPDQPREEFDEAALDRLAESIRSKGQLQPISVRWVQERGQYIIIAGERRWRAATRAGVETVTCIVVDREMDASEVLAIQCIENLLREDLLPVEQARAFRTLMDANGWSGNQLAKELGISQPAVVAALKLLNLPDQVQAMVESGELPASAASTIAGLENPEDQVEVATRAVAERMTRDDVAGEVRRRASKATSTKGKAAKAKLRKLTERTIRTANGPRVTVEWKRGLDLEAIALSLGDALSTIRAEMDAA